VTSGSANDEAARAFVAYITSAEAAGPLKAAGVSPAGKQ
jgi:ABC-type Fe3+ transport system substrate-binding protein